ncbi:MAG TPA: MMPL family transporter [Solirubrobacteraceae bacterium]|nr:MMPL family transporter [Solirubrobacteraceae bacterium]
MTSSPSHAPSVFARLALWCMSHRWQTFLIWIVAVVAAFAIGGATGTREASNYRLPGTDTQRAYDLLAAHEPKANGGTDQLVYVAHTGTLRAGVARKQMLASLAKVRRDPIVTDVSDPAARGGQLTKDGLIGVSTVTYKHDFQAYKAKDFTRIEKEAFAARSPALQIEHGGTGAEFARPMGASTEYISVIAAALILMLTFGSVIAAGVPLLTAMLALGTTIGLVPVISQVVDTPDFATQLAALIGLGVGVDYALIVVTRYRAEYGRGDVTREEAIVRAQDTAGRTVFFAACTVVIALLGLLLLGLSFLHGPAIASALAVLLTMLGALTVLPALLSRSGDWIDRLRLPLPGRARRSANAAAGESAAWARWSGFVQRRPLPCAVAALAVLLALASPALGMRIGTSDAGLDPTGSTTRSAYDLIAKGFGPGINGAFLLATKLPHAGDTAAGKQIAAAAGRDPGVAAVLPARLSPDGKIAIITLFPKTAPQDAATTKLLDRLRGTILPAAERKTQATVYVGGQTAGQEDFSDAIAAKLPLFVGTVVLLSALLLMAVFRSVFIPVKAACMNLLSIGAALGFVTLVFQKGFMSGVLDTGTGPVESFVPVMMFAIVFGLSMDYEVFLVSRMHEEWQHTGDASTAIRNGLATTGRVVSAAATIMVVVFATFAIGDQRVIKEFGIGLAIAVFLDAFVIRCLLVPALMQLAGSRAWWLPSGLDRRLPQIALERE